MRILHLPGQAGRRPRVWARVEARGRIALSDVTREPGAPGELTDLMAWMACLADARPAEAYASCLVAAGFRDVTIERHDDALTEMVRAIGAPVGVGGPGWTQQD
jgi:hypothetical protein